MARRREPLPDVAMPQKSSIMFRIRNNVIAPSPVSAMTDGDNVLWRRKRDPNEYDLLNMLPDYLAVCVLDAGGYVLQCSPALSELIDLPTDADGRRNLLRSAVHLSDRCRLSSALHSVLASSEGHACRQQVDLCLVAKGRDGDCHLDWTISATAGKLLVLAIAR
jgi:hypothetical protein